MFNFSTLPSKVSTTIKLMPDITRRESVEIVGETILKTPEVKKRRFSTRSKSTSNGSRSKMMMRYQTTLTPSRAFKWASGPEARKRHEKPLPSSGRYFHAICYRASVTRRRRDLRIETMEWTKFHMVVFDDVLVFFSSPNYNFDSRVHLSSVKVLKRVRISGKSTTYFGTIKPFVVRFQTRKERSEFRKIMAGTLEPNNSVNLSSMESDAPPIVCNLSAGSSEDPDDDDVFLPSESSAESAVQNQTPYRRRVRSVPEENSGRVRHGSRSKMNFRSLRKALNRKGSSSGDRAGFMETLRQKSRAFKNKFMS